jgi:hypothetical protein
LRRTFRSYGRLQDSWSRWSQNHGLVHYRITRLAHPGAYHGERFAPRRIVGDFLSYDPYGIIYRKDDPQLTAVVNATFQQLAQSGELEYLYKKWFMRKLPSGETLNLPMSEQLQKALQVIGMRVEGRSDFAPPRCAGPLRSLMNNCETDIRATDQSVFIHKAHPRC